MLNRTGHLLGTPTLMIVVNSLVLSFFCFKMQRLFGNIFACWSGDSKQKIAELQLAWNFAALRRNLTI